MLPLMFLGLFFLLICSAFFSGSEVAIFSLSKIRIKRMIHDKIPNAEFILKMAESPRDLLITLLVGNEFVNISASSIGAAIVISIFGEKALSISVFVMTLLLLLFGEITPKTFAVHYADRIAPAVTPIIRIFSTIITPLRLILKKIADLIITLLTKNRKDTSSIITDDELKMVIDYAYNDGVIDEFEKFVINNILSCNSVPVVNIMTPKVNFVSLEANLTCKQAIHQIKNKPYPRIPVFESGSDKEKIAGILYLKNLIIHNLKTPNKPIRDILREPHYVPETTTVATLFKHFQSTNEHIAIVVDEYGVVLGMVTIQDIMESIIGSIKSETKEDKKYDFIDNNTIILDPAIELKKFNEIWKTRLFDKNTTTFAGWLTTNLGRIPQKTESFKTDGLYIEVLDAQPNKVKKVKVIRATPNL